jgi:single-strand DNA-binding protein
VANLNRIILVGRLTADPEGRATMDGIPMTKFRLAVARQFGGTDFIDVIAWRRVAEVCSDYLKKGRLVLVEGRIQIRSFEDQTGQRRWATEVIARNVQMLDKTSTSSVESSNVQGPKSPAGKEDLTSDIGPETGEEAVEDIDLASDLPF